MMLAYSSNCYSVTGVDKVTLISSYIRIIHILDLPKYWVGLFTDPWQCFLFIIYWAHLKARL